jgi:hypothetical protein
MAEQIKGERSGGSVNYYKLHIDEPANLPEPYDCECEDIIEALNMTLAEANQFKSVWRSAAARTLGKVKHGPDPEGIYDGEKSLYYAQRTLIQRRRAKRARDQLAQGQNETLEEALATAGAASTGGTLMHAMVDKLRKKDEGLAEKPAVDPRLGEPESDAPDFTRVGKRARPLAWDKAYTGQLLVYQPEDGLAYNCEVMARYGEHLLVRVWSVTGVTEAEWPQGSILALHQCSQIHHYIPRTYGDPSPRVFLNLGHPGLLTIGQTVTLKGETFTLDGVHVQSAESAVRLICARGSVPVGSDITILLRHLLDLLRNKCAVVHPYTLPAGRGEGA